MRESRRVRICIVTKGVWWGFNNFELGYFFRFVFVFRLLIPNFVIILRGNININAVGRVTENGTLRGFWALKYSRPQVTRGLNPKILFR